MDNLFKKKLIAILLTLACVISTLSLIRGQEPMQAINPADADSLLLKELSVFNIPSDKISWTRIDVDSTFYRKNYRVRLPVGTSRTWFHSELSRKLYDHNMTTWANVEFPENSMKIHILGSNTILRSISLETDTSYHRRLNPATVMIYFDRAPTKAIMDRIDAFGEPISMVLRVQSATQAEAWAERLGPTRHRYYFWMSEDGHYPGDVFNEARFIERSRDLTKASNRPGLLFFQPTHSRPGPDFFKRLAEKNISLIQTGDAMIITPFEGKVHFDREFAKFSRLARAGQHPVALVQASEQSLDWFANNLTELKKGGTVLTLPRQVTE